MLQPSPPARLLVTCCLCASLMLLAVGASAAPPGFDLDLKELKKPPAVIVTHKKQAPVQKAPTKAPAAARTTTKKTAAPTKTALPSKKLVSPPVPNQTPVPPDVAEQIILLDGKTACRLAQLLLEAVAEPAPVAETLQGLPLSAASAARLQGATVLLTCGLPTAEAYTFGRLLEAERVTLINVAADQPLAVTVDQVAQALGLSYRLLQDNPLSYLTSDQQGRPLRLVIGTSSTSN